MEITAQQLKALCPRLGMDAQLLAAVTQGVAVACAEADLNTVDRQAMFLAQVIHESGGFRWMTELGGKEYFEMYEGRRDLGNVEEGDGYRFRGRGWIQLTGRANYARAAEALGIDLVADPSLAATNHTVAARIAAWFWRTHDLNPIADQQDVKRVTKRINGGYTGLSSRLAQYRRCLQVLMGDITSEIQT